MYLIHLHLIINQILLLAVQASRPPYPSFHSLNLQFLLNKQHFSFEVSCIVLTIFNMKLSNGLFLLLHYPNLSQLVFQQLVQSSAMPPDQHTKMPIILIYFFIYRYRPKENLISHSLYQFDPLQLQLKISIYHLNLDCLRAFSFINSKSLMQF